MQALQGHRGTKCSTGRRKRPEDLRGKYLSQIRCPLVPFAVPVTPRLLLRVWPAAQIHQHAGQQINAGNDARQVGVVVHAMSAAAKYRYAVDAGSSGFRREGNVG